MEQQIAFNENGLYIRLHGPFPQEVVAAANSSKQFDCQKDLLRWLDLAWPTWRKNIVRSENLY